MNGPVSNQALQPVEGFTSPGTILRLAREAAQMTEREAADRLNLMPDYVGILERDDYQALRSPAFARGYLKAYARLLEIDEERVMPLYDEIVAQEPTKERIETKPLQLQHTRAGVAVSLVLMLLLVAALWWWQGDAPRGTASTSAINSEINVSGNNPALYEDALEYQP